MQGWILDPGGSRFSLVYWGLPPQQQPGPYQGGEMMKSVFWWRKPEYPEETTDLRQVTDETFHTYGLCPVRGLNLGRREGQGLQGIQEGARTDGRRDMSRGGKVGWGGGGQPGFRGGSLILDCGALR